MKRVERLWFKALELGIDDKLINLLSKLRVINADVRWQYQEISHLGLIEYRRRKEEKRSRQSARDYSTPYRAPKSIKPTKTR